VALKRRLDLLSPSIMSSKRRTATAGSFDRSTAAKNASCLASNDEPETFSQLNVPL
jgi:hypothetical protein